MQLQVVFDVLQADRFRSYGASDGGFGRLALKLWERRTRIDDERYESTLTEFSAIVGFVRQRSTDTSGGWQDLLKSTDVMLDLGEGRTLTAWPVVRSTVMDEERRRHGEQLRLFARKRRRRAVPDDDVDESDGFPAEEQT